jgi:hypothetical protein
MLAMTSEKSLDPHARNRWTFPDVQFVADAGSADT